MSQYNMSSYSSSRGQGSLFGNIDLVTLGLYIGLVFVGVISIISASYDPEVGSRFSFSHNYMKQIMWVGIASVVALVILLLERRYFHMFAYPAYILGICMLLACLFFGTKVNGAWF